MRIVSNPRDVEWMVYAAAGILAGGILDVGAARGLLRRSGKTN